MLKKILPVLPFLVLGLFGLLLFATPEKSEGEGEFKNVQVLTDLSGEELRDFMAQVVEDLGVKKCTFCHVKDKSSDEKEHKQIARKFMKMVKEINEGELMKEMDSKITCYTCHRGQEHPFHSAEEEENASKEGEE